MADVDQIQASVEEMQALQKAFVQFSRQTGVLRQAYDQLKAEAERINVALEQTNRELQQKVRELDEANNFQRSILSSIPTAVVVTDLEGVINTFNAVAEEMWGVSAREAVGTHYRQVLGEHGGLLDSVLSGRCREESLRREVGGENARVIASTACLVEDSSRRPIGVIQVDRDITRLRDLEAQVYQQQKLADLGEMAAGLAHEVRKPLNGIKGFASLIRRDTDEGAAYAKYASRIMEATDRLNGMLSRLLDFAKPNALECGPCDLLAEAQSILDFVCAEDPGGAEKLSLDIPEDARVVFADRDKVQQILLNLVKNGMEALEGPGRVVVKARAEGEGQTRRVRVAVTDTGRGIPAEKLGKVGEPFYTDKEGGTGLGLAVVTRLLQLHGSELHVESEPGVGTSMEFLLPAAGEAATT